MSKLINQMPELELIVCPWCFSQTKIDSDQEINQCHVCEREITVEDLEYANHKEI